MKLKELADILRTHVKTGPHMPGTPKAFGAELHRVVVLGENGTKAAAGYGTTQAKALRALVDCIQREAIEYRAPHGGDTMLDLIRVKIQPGKVSDFK
jgi:hypothetical protein